MGGIHSLCQGTHIHFDMHMDDEEEQEILSQRNQRSGSGPDRIQDALTILKRAGASEETLERVRICIAEKNPTLVIDDNSLSGFPGAVLAHLGHLESLKLSGNQIDLLPEDFGNYLPRLKTLSLYRLPALRQLPDSVGNLASLLELEICNADALLMLPESFGDLANLERLGICRCKAFIYLPESLGKLSKLEMLVVNKVNLRIFPKSLVDLVNLRELNITELPSLTLIAEDFGALGRLEKLIISGCPLERLPIGINSLINLETLELCGLRIESVSEDIGNLIKLQKLCLSINRLSSLPKSIACLGRLRELWLDLNPFVDIPVCVTQLPKGCIVFLDGLLYKENFGEDVLKEAIERIKASWRMDENKGPGQLRRRCEEVLGRVQIRNGTFAQENVPSTLLDQCEANENLLPSAG